jgi:hypothetical protein
VVVHADGSGEVDVSKRIIVPEDEAAWTDFVEAACMVLTVCSLDAYSDLIKPVPDRPDAAAGEPGQSQT